MRAHDIPWLTHPGDIQVGNTILAQARKKYLVKLEIYLALGSAITLVSRFFSDAASAHGLISLIWLVQGGAVSLGIYAVWQLLTPKGKKFRFFLLDQSIVDNLKQSLTKQGWEALMTIRARRQNDHFCVDDILVALQGNGKNG